MLETKAIAKRIAKTDELGQKVDALEIEGASAELITELATVNILAELMESLKNGETLEEAIQTIHANC